MLKVNDRVRMSSKWLRSIGAFTGPLGQARGTIREFKRVSKDFVLVRIDWDTPDTPTTVNLKNVESIR